MKIDEIIERLDTIIDILNEMDNAATPNLVEAVEEAKTATKKRHDTRDQIAGELTLENMRRNQQKTNDELAKLSAAADNFFDQFIIQLMRENNKKKDDKFGR